MSDRAFRIHFARVHLAECRARRRSRVNRDFYWLLFATTPLIERYAALAAEGRA